MGCSSNQSHKKGSHQDNSCCCSGKSGCSCCCDCSCHDGGCHEEEDCCNGASLLELADEAWTELLKEKIKGHILANDHKLDELAKLVSDANHKRWANKLKQDKCSADYDNCCDEFEEQLCKLFSSCHSDSCKADSQGNNQKK